MTLVERIAKALGIDLSRVPQGADMRFEWGSLPQGQEALLVVLVGLGLVALVGALYRREGAAAAWRKVLLATLRSIVIGLAFVVLLEPRIAIDVERKLDATTIVLWDESLSMSIPDRYHDQARRDAIAAASGIAAEKLATVPRAEVARAIVERAKLLPGLARRNKLKVYAFAEDARAVKEALDEKEIAPKGPATDLARAVRKALEEQGGRTIAAVVAITDGRSNKGDGARAIAALLKERGGADRAAAPFYAIGIGDPQAPKNIEVAELAANERAYKNDPIVLEARVRARGYEGEKVEAELLVSPREDPSKAEKVETRTVTLPADGGVERLSFTYVPKTTGELLFTLRIAPRDEEPVKEDNQRTFAVSVIDDETRVLLVSGGSTYEFRGLKTLLLREKTVKLAVLLQSADADFAGDSRAEKIESMPRTKEEMFKYDVIVLCDPAPRAFDQDVVDLLSRFVGDHGGGLLYVAGEKWTSVLLKSQELKAFDVLPVSLDDRGDAASRLSTEPFRVRITDEAEDHPVTRLDQDIQRSRAIWSHLPPVYWYLPGAREKPGAVVLLRSDDPRAETARGSPPLIAAQFYGPGRTLFFGFDETWRWRSVARRSYERLWVQALRFLVEGRLLGGRRRLELTTDKDEYSLGEPVRVRTKALDKSYQPLHADELEAVARIEGTDVARVALKKTKERPGTYEGSFIPQARGEIEVFVRLPDSQLEEKPARKTIRVRLPDLEFSNPRLDEELLREIADETRGRLVAPGEVGSLADVIPSRTETLRVPAEPIPLWDRKPVIALAVALLAIEWFIRKRSRMV